jgi:hypothetical protein
MIFLLSNCSTVYIVGVDSDIATILVEKQKKIYALLFAEQESKTYYRKSYLQQYGVKNVDIILVGDDIIDLDNLMIEPDEILMLSNSDIIYIYKMRHDNYNIETKSYSVGKIKRNCHVEVHIKNGKVAKIIKQYSFWEMRP